MHPLTTADDAEYRAERADAATEAAQHRNDASRQSTRKGGVMFTLDGAFCTHCGRPVNGAWNCSTECGQGEKR
jgi:hypothetical protein